jgi:hypothetical protein
VAAYEAASTEPPASFVVVLTSTASQPPPEEEDPFIWAPRLLINDSGMTAVLYGRERRETLLPLAANYIVPLR